MASQVGNQSNSFNPVGAGVTGTALDPAGPAGSVIDLAAPETIGILPLSQLPAHAPTVHAPSHQDGGADEVGTATPAADAIPKADAGAKLDTWISQSTESVDGIIEIATQAEVDAGTDDVRAVTSLKLANAASSGMIFGSEYDTLEATSSVFVSGPGFTQYLKLTTASIPAGDYLIQWMFVWNATKKADRIQVRVQVDDTVDLINPSDTGVFTINVPVDGTVARFKESGYRVVTLTAAAHDIDLDWEQVGIAGVSTIFQGALTIWRVL